MSVVVPSCGWQNVFVCCCAVFHSSFPWRHERPAFDQQGNLYGNPWLRSSCCGI